MGWVDALKGHRVGLDTAPLIYFTEQNGAYLERVDPFFAALAKGELQVVTSVMTLLEVLVRPIRDSNLTLIQTYREFLLNKATYFLTNDIVLASLPEIKILVLDDLKEEEPDKET